jgi:hypothetical protein
VGSPTGQTWDPRHGGIGAHPPGVGGNAFAARALSAQTRGAARASTLLIDRLRLSGLVIAANDEQLLTRRAIPPRRIIVHAAVAHVHAIDDGIPKRSAALITLPHMVRI